MSKEDHYHKEFERIALFLQEAIASLKQKKSGSVAPYVKEINQKLKEDYDIELENNSSDELLYNLESRTGFNFMNMEYMADLIQLIADSETEQISQQGYLVKSLAIYSFVDKKNKTYSTDRREKMKNIERRIK